MEEKYSQSPYNDTYLWSCKGVKKMLPGGAYYQDRYYFLYVGIAQDLKVCSHS